MERRLFASRAEKILALIPPADSESELSDNDPADDVSEVPSIPENVQKLLDDFLEDNEKLLITYSKEIPTNKKKLAFCQ